MGKAPKPYPFRLGDLDMVAMSLEEYERLLGTRRQIGAQATRIRTLKLQLDLTSDRLAKVEALLRAHEESDGSCDGDCCARAIAQAITDRT
ncbi:hypothetical protein ACIBKY_44620 [Nonomuraea sp. NPDC050394]|uniref:hypothetical protein n=1 Tax=Nonomuraea sp. NPDC050394 TaxID=3364363 RepID=UPI0037B6A5F4